MNHLDELLSVYLDGEANPAESARVQGHLAECLRCRNRLSVLNAARAAVRSMPTLETPMGLLPAPVVDTPRSRRPVWVGAAAAAVAAIIAIATVVTPPPEPVNLADISRQLGARASLDSGAAPLKIVPPVGVHE